MVRQGLRSLLNGRANLQQHFLPPSPKSRKPKAERPKSRKADRRKAGGPESRIAEKPKRLRSGRSEQNLVCACLKQPVCHVAMRHATTQGATWRQEHLMFSSHYFPVKASRLPNPPTIPLYLTATFEKRNGFNADLLEPGYVKFWAPKSDNLSFNMRPPGVRFGRRCEASTHKRWGNHPYEISNFPQRSGVRIQAYIQADASARGCTPECGGPISSD
jgi:hypothetical protein